MSNCWGRETLNRTVMENFLWDNIVERGVQILHRLLLLQIRKGTIREIHSWLGLAIFLYLCRTTKAPLSAENGRFVYYAELWSGGVSEFHGSHSATDSREIPESCACAWYGTGWWYSREKLPATDLEDKVQCSEGTKWANKLSWITLLFRK